MPSEPSTLPKSTTEARMNLTSGPAATAEAKKNKKKRMRSDQTDASTPPPLRLTPATATVTVPAEVVMTDPIPPVYPPSETSPTPPPIPMPPFINEDSPSPLSSPSSYIGALNTPRIPQANLAPDRTTVSPTLQDKSEDSSTTTGSAPRQPTRSAGSEKDITMTNPVRPAGTNLFSVRSLVETTPHDTVHSGRNITRDPLDNYTNATMPKVHDAHPTSPFHYIDLDLISEWELLVGGKLLIIPFGDAPHEPKLHEILKNRILYAIAEITNSQGIGISAPTPNAEATRTGRFPSSFLAYNLTIPQKQLLLDRGVWSSQAISFRATPFYPTNPNYLFTIRGFSLNIEDHIQSLVYNIWHDNDTTRFAQDTVNAAPEEDRTTLALAIRTLLDSPSVTCLNIKERGGGLSPRFNIYANGSTIPHHAIWLDIRKFLADRIYFTPLIGRGEVIISPYACGICHGVDHPRGLCPFPSIKGWNGPGKEKNSENQQGRNGGQHSQSRYGTGRSTNKGIYRM